MPINQQDLQEKFKNYRKSLNDIKNDLILKIKDIRKKDDAQKVTKILEDLNNK